MIGIIVYLFTNLELVMLNIIGINEILYIIVLAGRHTDIKLMVI
ncbi:MAG: hypothetical protein HeimC3_26920 [Candidatus Heimdallarchaeota archaeon LC_3]|nr:MAG: hypothetical protein HeimC3_26920 [Candidatus Heimdallarchaeota archaeon LC_3]